MAKRRAKRRAQPKAGYTARLGRLMDTYNEQLFAEVQRAVAPTEFLDLMGFKHGDGVWTYRELHIILPQDDVDWSTEAVFVNDGRDDAAVAPIKHLLDRRLLTLNNGRFAMCVAVWAESGRINIPDVAAELGDLEEEFGQLDNLQVLE